MILIVGLGNPNKKYQKTRHNAGFMAVDFLIQESFGKKIKWHDNKKEKYLHLQQTLEGQEIEFIKPQAYMNNSGLAAATARKKHQINPENIWVIHDDIDIPLGNIKISRDISSAGHKGVESIIKSLGTQNFIRFRIGIKPEKPTSLPAEKYVLQNFTKTEMKIMQEVIARIGEAVSCNLKEGIDKTMNKFNS